MNRRNFFGAMGAAGLITVLGREPEVRNVRFSAPGEPPAIYWMRGHVAIDDFVSLHSVSKATDLPIDPAYVKHGWATRKLDYISLYLSGTPQPNFEPITYWIPADAA